MKKARKQNQTDLTVAWRRTNNDSTSGDVHIGAERRSSLHQFHAMIPQNMIYSTDQIRLSNTIGQGEMGLVYKAYLTTREGTQIVAVKMNKALSSKGDERKMMKELSTMLSFDHPNVMTLIGTCFKRDTPLIIMPFMSNGNVLEHVKQRREELLLPEGAPETQVVSARKLLLGMCHQIAKGMEYLAENMFVHRDLAARNCMIDQNGVIKVADFGLTEDMYGTKYYHQNSEARNDEKVPIRWMAPESLERDVYTQSTDVWAFGVTCWEVFTCGRVPYSGIPALSLLTALRNGERLDTPNNTACSDEINNAILDCWATDPKDRPRFAHLVKQFCSFLEQDAGYLELSVTSTNPTQLLPECGEGAAESVEKA